MTETTPPDRERARGERLWMLGLFLLACLVYLNALWNGFAADDVRVVQENAAIRGDQGLRGLLLAPYWPGSKELYRPVTMVSLALDWAISGGAAWWFHLVNVLLHALVTVLVFRLVRGLGAETVLAAAGAAVFAVHPVHVEAVSSVVGRSELLAGLFVLIACLLHLRARRRGAAYVAMMAGLYFLGLAAKEIAVTLPALLLLLELRREGLAPVRVVRGLLPVWLAQGAALAGYLVLRQVATERILGGTPVAYLDGLATGDRVATALRLWPEYLRLLLWPADLTSDWGPPLVPLASFSEPGAWLSLLLLVILGMTAWLDARRGSGWFALGFAWFAVVILPISQFFFPIGTLLAERTLYVPSICLALVFPALGELRRVARTPIPQAALALVLLLGAVRTWTRTPVWRSTQAVRDDVLINHPESWRSQWYLGDAYASVGDGARARIAFHRAVELTRENDLLILLDAARLDLRVGEPRSAERLARRVLEKQPDNERAKMLIAAAKLQQGRAEESLRYADSLLAAGVGGPAMRQWMHHYAALAQDALGRPDAALRRSTQALAQRDPWGRTVVWLHHARLRGMAGDSAAARAALDSAQARIPLEAAVRLPPTSPALGGLGTPLPGGGG